MIDGRWQEQMLSDLPVEHGLRLRGSSATRLDVFVGAAFAFAATLLIMSADSIPGSYAAFLQALEAVPAVLACFALLTSFWWGHHLWSRRYGLQDTGATLLSLTLVGLVLVYVQPLQVIFGALFASFTGGSLPVGFDLTALQLADLFVVFGFGFAAMSGVIMALFVHALRHHETLLLDELEYFQTVADALSWAVLAATGMCSCLLAWLLPGELGPLAGYVYWSLIVTMPLTDWFITRQRRRRFGSLITSLPAA